MFSFIHTADIHLDSPLRGLNQHEGAPVEEIRGATRKALTNIVDLALEKNVAFVVIAGDLYDGDWPDYSTGQFFTNQMRRLKEANILVYLITGNHDAASKITKSLTLPDNVTLFSTKKPESHKHPDLPCTLHGQGFAKQSEQENLAATYPEADEDHFNIGILHTSLAGNPEHDTYAPCSMDDLTTRGYQYWALGHIHQHEILHSSPHVVYSGNPQGRHAKETGERGCYLVEVDEQLEISSISFAPTDVVRWQHLELDITGLANMDAVIDELRSSMQAASTSIQDSDRLQLLALRITLTGSTSLHGELHADLARWQIECTEIAQDLASADIWFERLRIKTTPTYDVKELAERDELTALVLDALEHFSPSSAGSDPITSLKTKLGGIDASLFEAYLDPSSDEDKQQLADDVAAIVLQSISHSAS